MAGSIYWKRLAPIVDYMIRWQLFLRLTVSTHLDWFGLRGDALRIIKPQGVFDLHI